MVNLEWLTIFSIAIIVQRLGELYFAEKNRRKMLQAGAKEYGQEHYPYFFILHTLWIAGWVVEGGLLGSISTLWYFWLALIAAAQILRYWCIVSLGRCWNTRILVLPGMPLIKKGPYGLFRHPNYLAVAIEIISIPMFFQALYTGIIASALNGWLLWKVRIPMEEKALQGLSANVK